MSARTLAVGDVIEATPCTVTIRALTDWTAVGRCSFCMGDHAINRKGYDAGRGPWNPPRSDRRDES